MILVVCDQQSDMDVIDDLLNPDYQIVAVRNGEQALNAVRADTPPDLILLGLMKTAKKATDLCRQLRANQTTWDIPVIVITADSESRILDAGAVDCITKPIVPTVLKARINTHLALRQKTEELHEANLKNEILSHKMAKELTVGREIQKRIVPSDFPAFPDRDEFDVYATLQPAREFEGDFYDFF